MTNHPGHAPLADEALEQLRALGDPGDAAAKARYLQAFPGGYAEGDTFLGVRVPAVRTVARGLKSRATPAGVAALIEHPVHEMRLLGAILAVELYKPAKTPQERRSEIVDVVLARIEHLDNWDLVDTVAPFTLGPWLLDQPVAQQDSLLDDFVTSQLIWRRRFAMVATLGMIRAGDLRQAFRVAELLIDDEEDLIHKAVGWMLREAGIRDRDALDAFLDRHAATMPRTALRYALEKHDSTSRSRYMAARSDAGIRPGG